MSGQAVLFTALTLAAVGVAATLIVSIMKLTRTAEHLARRLDETLRQLEMTAEDVRRTSAKLREIVTHAERGAANIEHVTEGIRGFRSTLDAASAVLQYAVVPVLGNVAGGLAGVKAAVSHVLSRAFRKEGGHE